MLGDVIATTYKLNKSIARLVPYMMQCMLCDGGGGGGGGFENITCLQLGSILCKSIESAW